MQIAKLMLAGCALVLGATLLQAQSQTDSDEQAKARAALRQKLQEMQGTPAQPAPATAPATVPAAAPVQPKPQPPPAAAPAPKPTAAPTRQGVPPAAVAPVTTSVQPASKPVPPPAAKPVVTSKPAPAPVVTKSAPAPTVTKSATGPKYNPAAQRQDSANVAQAREAMRQKMNELDAQGVPADVELPSPHESPKEQLEATPVFAPIPGPGSPLPANKQERLAVLLRKYKADQITPQEYHTERAKIIAEQ